MHHSFLANVFLLQGITMKPLVNWLKVKKAAVSELTLIEKLQSKVKLEIFTSYTTARTVNRQLLQKLRSCCLGV